MNGYLERDPAIIDADVCICCGYCEPEYSFNAIEDCCSDCIPPTFLVRQDKCEGNRSCQYPCIPICPVAAICKRSEYKNGSCP